MITVPRLSPGQYMLHVANDAGGAGSREGGGGMIAVAAVMAARPRFASGYAVGEPPMTVPLFRPQGGVFLLVY
jgi:hypothetical protein